MYERRYCACVTNCDRHFLPHHLTARELPRLTHMRGLAPLPPKYKGMVVERSNSEFETLMGFFLGFPCANGRSAAITLMTSSHTEIGYQLPLHVSGKVRQRRRRRNAKYASEEAAH